MKRIILAITLIALMTLGTISYGEVIWMDGGIVGDLQIGGSNEYQEVTFITGEPVVLKGLVKLPVIPEDSDSYTLKYTFNLQNLEKGVALTRNATYQVTKVPNTSIMQTTYEKKLTAYTEEITTPAGTFTLGKFTFLESRIIDNTPAVDYYSGNIISERTYYRNGNFTANTGKIDYIIDAKPIVGYDHEWGNSETQVIQHSIKAYTFEDGTYVPEWDGYVNVGMATTRKVDFNYQYTDPQNISFRGNYFKVTTEENVLTYDYNMPQTSGGAIVEGSLRRNTDELRLNEEVIIESKALITPRIRDIGGHWAEDYIFLLTSLQVFDIDKEFFVPSASISRLEFGKAIVNVINGVLPEPTRTEITKRLRPGVETPFLDVLPSDPNYHYMEYIEANGIMYGRNYYFKGNEPLTRAEAIAIMIRTLGIQYMAPAPPYNTHYADDASIPEWAKDAIYMASEVGLVNGTPEGNINPNGWVRKDEAAAMLVNYINHVKDEISYDYREKILNR